MAERAVRLTTSSVKSALQSIIAPFMDEIKSSIKILETKHAATNTKIGSFRNEMQADVAPVEQKVTAHSERIDLIKDVEKLKIEVAEHPAAQI